MREGARYPLTVTASTAGDSQIAVISGRRARVKERATISGRAFAGLLDQVVAYSTDAFLDTGRPWETPGAGWLSLCFFHLYAKAGSRSAALLEFGTEPANQPSPLFGGACGVEFD